MLRDDRAAYSYDVDYYELGRSGYEGRVMGLWFSTQSLAAFLRIFVLAMQLDRTPGFDDVATWAPTVLWLCAAAVFGGLVWQAGKSTEPAAVRPA